VPPKLLDRITICRPLEITLTRGDRIHLKANRTLSAGNRVANGELVTVRSVRPDGAIELEDGRTLDANYREFLPGYAVTSYGSQGKTVDYDMLDVNYFSIYRLIQRGKLKVCRALRGKLLVPRTELLKLLKTE